MESLLFNPAWFSGFDHAFELISLLTAVFVAYYSYRVYRFTEQPKYRTMALAFMLIAISFGVKVFTDVGVRMQVADIGGVQTLTQVMEIGAMLQSGYLAMRFLMLLGLVLFLKLAFDIRNNRLLLLLGFFAMMVTFFSNSAYYAFHIAAAVMLGFIVEFLFCNYRKKKTIPAGMVLSSFTLLLLSQLAFVFVAESAILYPIGETLQLGGFILLIMNHVLMLRR